MSESHRSSKRKAPVESLFSERFDDTSVDDRSSVPGTATYVIRDDGSLTQEEKNHRRRRRFDPQRRQEVALVRKLGACEDCRHRKIRCPHALQKEPGMQRVSKTPPTIHFESLNPDLVKASSAGIELPIEGDQEIDLLDSQAQIPDDTGSLEWERNIPTPTGRLNQVTNDVHHLEKIIEGDRADSTQPMIREPWSGLENSAQFFSDGFGPSANIRLDAYRGVPPRRAQKKHTFGRRQPFQQTSLQLPIRSNSKNPAPQYRIIQRDRTAPPQDIIPAADYPSAPADLQFRQNFVIPKPPFVDPLAELYSKEGGDQLMRPSYEASQGGMSRSLGSHFMGLPEASQSIGTALNLDYWQNFSVGNSRNPMLFEPLTPMRGEHPDADGWALDFRADGLPSQSFAATFTDPPQADQYSTIFSHFSHDSAIAGTDFTPQPPPFNGGGAYLPLCTQFGSTYTPSANLNPPSMDYGLSSTSSGGNEVEYPNNHVLSLLAEDPEFGKPPPASRFARKGEYDFREQ